MQLKKKVLDAINEQINMEFGSGYLYLSMSAWFESENLPGMATWMKSQAQEEIGHGMKMYQFVFQRGNAVELKAIAKPQATWKSPLEAFQAALGHERKVTKSIENLTMLARKEKDPATENMLQWFVTEQVEEEATASEIVDKLKLAKGTPGALFMIDRELGTRGTTQN